MQLGHFNKEPGYTVNCKWLWNHMDYMLFFQSTKFWLHFLVSTCLNSTKFLNNIFVTPVTTIQEYAVRRQNGAPSGVLMCVWEEREGRKEEEKEAGQHIERKKVEGGNFALSKTITKNLNKRAFGKKGPTTHIRKTYICFFIINC